MCRPTYFAVRYEINAWMHRSTGVDQDLAVRQWEALRSTYRALGHDVEVIEGVPGQPDMVFTANAGTMIGGRVVTARFAHVERRGEEAPFAEWFRAHAREVIIPEHVNEGEGDLLWTGSVLLAASGFRSDPGAGAEIGAALGVPIVSLRLVDPRFYHLDTALTVLDTDHIAYLPEAFDAASRTELRRRFPDALVVSRADADWFGLNAASDGRNVVVAAQATGFADQLAAAGYHPVPVDMSEFRKSGGGIKCCTLELRG